MATRTRTSTKASARTSARGTKAGVRSRTAARASTPKRSTGRTTSSRRSGGTKRTATKSRKATGPAKRAGSKGIIIIGSKTPSARAAGDKGIIIVGSRTPAAARAVKGFGLKRTPPKPGEPAEVWSTVTPHLTVDNASEAIAWYTRVFGARELSRMPGPDGKLLHAMIQVGDSGIMLSDRFQPGTDTGQNVTVHIHDKGIDGMWQRATQEGATVRMALADQFWGDRYGQLVDPFGISWSLGTKANLSEADRARLQQEAMAQMSAGGHPGQ